MNEAIQRVMGQIEVRKNPPGWPGMHWCGFIGGVNIAASAKGELHMRARVQKKVAAILGAAEESLNNG